MTQFASPAPACLPDALALRAIRFYQRRLSPHKGFRCAHAALHGGQSCSAAVADLIASHGLLAARPHIAARFGECRQAHQLLRHTPQAGLPVGAAAQGVFCCGGIPIPFRCG